MKTIILAAALLAAPALASAQSVDAPSIREGARVKIRTPAIHAAVGSVVAATPDSLMISDERGARLGFARSEITQFYVSQGPSSRAGAMKGALWGAGFGAAAALMMAGNPCAKASDVDRCNNDHRGESRVGLAAANFAAMTLGGVIAGAVIKAEDWKAVPSQPRISVRATGSGIALAVNFR